MITKYTFERKFPELSILWGTYFTVDADDGIFDEKVTIDRYIYGPAMIPRAKKALIEARQVLNLEPFPENLVVDLTYTYSSIVTMKEWVKEYMIPALEARIKEVGSWPEEEIVIENVEKTRQPSFLERIYQFFKRSR